MQTVFVCGGRGTRLQPRQAGAKTLVSVGHSTLLEQLVRSIGAEHHSDAPPIVIVDAHDAETPDVARVLLPSAIVVRQRTPDGVANALLLAYPHLAESVIVALGDVFLDGVFGCISAEPALVYWANAPESDTQKNFGIRWRTDGTVTHVVEKPAVCGAMRCGTGVYVLNRTAISCFRRAPVDPATGERGITEGIQAAIDAGVTFRMIPFRGYYNNVNSPSDLIAAEEYISQRERYDRAAGY